MVYVGKKGEGTPPEDEMRIPHQYSGNAFGADGERRGFDIDGDALRHAEELFRRGYVFEDTAGVGEVQNDDSRTRPPAGNENKIPHDAGRGYHAGNTDDMARPAGRDGYIDPPRFGEAGITVRPVGREPGLGDDGRGEPMRDEPEKGVESVAARPDDAAAASKARRDDGRISGRRSPGGFLPGIFDRITTEEILLGAIILMLFMNGSDDELLIMLVVLLFC